MTCKNCGAAVGADDRFCPICGVSTAGDVGTRFCTQCGERLDRRDRFCQRCGVSVEKQFSDVPSDYGISSDRIVRYAGTSHPRNTIKTGKIIGTTLIMLCAAVFILGSLMHWWNF